MARRKYKDTLVTDRVLLTENILKRLGGILESRTVPELARQRRLPYQLIYNIANGRTRSISTRHYQKLFRSPPPVQTAKRVDGKSFRGLVRLWLFLNDQATEAELYREFFREHPPKRIDYRIFSGKIRTVPARLVRIMEEKFAASGLDRSTADRWVNDLDAAREKRIAYNRIRPALLHLHDAFGIHPNVLLGQSFQRYESGELKSVSQDVYEKVRRVSDRAARSMATGRQIDAELVKEAVYGGKEGYVLYGAIAEEIGFAKRHIRGSIRRYLGRSIATYERGASRRIASWRADGIVRACKKFIASHPGLPLLTLPRAHRRHHVNRLTSVLEARLMDLFSREDGVSLEKEILRPSRANEAYRQSGLGFTRFDQASLALGMHQRAFDLMVAKNCDIFRAMGKYTRKWYLSDLYLKELATREHFDLISTKYERLAERMSAPADACMN